MVSKLRIRSLLKTMIMPLLVLFIITTVNTEKKKNLIMIILNNSKLDTKTTHTKPLVIVVIYLYKYVMTVFSAK